MTKSIRVSPVISPVIRRLGLESVEIGVSEQRPACHDSGADNSLQQAGSVIQGLRRWARVAGLRARGCSLWLVFAAA